MFTFPSFNKYRGLWKLEILWVSIPVYALWQRPWLIVSIRFQVFIIFFMSSRCYSKMILCTSYNSHLLSAYRAAQWMFEMWFTVTYFSLFLLLFLDLIFDKRNLKVLQYCFLGIVSKCLEQLFISTQRVTCSSVLEQNV